MEQEQIIAIVYDFDGTLSAGNIQEYDFIPSLGMSIGEFWDSADEVGSKQDADPVLSYMERMISLAREKNIAVTRSSLAKMGEGVDLFEGLKDGWFERINSFGAERGVKIRHYVNSSGIREMIEGCPIACHFHKIYASSFLYNQSGEAYWPAVAINYTNKTQFIFKINKGIETVYDSQRVNEFVPRKERPVPFSRIIFIGDGLTDVPSMRLVHSMGGHAIAVYDPQRADKREDMMQLIREKRVNYVCEANYSASSQMNVLMESIIEKIVADEKLHKLQHEDSL